MDSYRSIMDLQKDDSIERFKNADSTLHEYDLLQSICSFDRLTAHPNWIDLLQIDQRRQWNLGNRRLVEEYIYAYSIKPEQVEQLTEIILNEITLAIEADDDVDLDAYVTRFPHVEKLVETHVELLCLNRNEVGPPSRRSSEAPRSTGMMQLPEGFRFLSVLGRGGMSEVVLAYQEKLRRNVAIKLMSVGLRNDRDRRRFHQESLTVARLQHPNIVQLIDVGEFEEQPYLVLEPIYGGNLHRWHNGVSLPTRQAAAIVAEAAKAIQYAHDCGVLHRDLKPSNLLLQPFDSSEPVPPVPLTSSNSTPNGSDSLPFCVKVNDFGLAKWNTLFDSEEMQSFHTRTGEILGTPAYMAPEQASGQLSSFAPTIDVYGLGAILYELVTGRPPFQGSVIDVLHQVRYEEARRPRLINRGIDHDMETIVRTAMANPPNARYPSAQALRDDLNRYISGQPIHARPISILERTIRVAKRNPIISGLATSLVASVLVTLVVLAISNRRIRESKNDLQFALNTAEIERQKEQISRREADANASLARRRYYAGQMQLASRAFRDSEVSRVQDCLLSVLPATDEVDLRGIEWHFLDNGIQRNSRLAYEMKDSEIRSLSLSKSSRWVASGNSRGLVEVWNLVTSEKHVDFGLSPDAGANDLTDVHALAFHPVDENVLAYCEENGEVVVVDVSDGRELIRTSPFSVCRSIAWLINGEGLCIGYENGWIRRWSYPQFQELPRIEADTGLIHRISFSNDGKFCVHASPWGPDGKHSKLWDSSVEPWREIASYSECYATGFTPESDFVVSIIWEDIKLIPTDGTVPEATKPKHVLAKGMLTNASYSHDGRYFYSSSNEDRTAKQWDSDIKTELQSIAGTGNMSCLAIDRAGQCWAGGMSTGHVVVWKVRPTPILPRIDWPRKILAINRADDDQSIFVCDSETTSRLSVLNGEVIESWTRPFARSMSVTGDTVIATFSPSMSEDDSLNYQHQSKLMMLKDDAEPFDLLGSVQESQPVTYRALDLSLDGRLLAIGLESGHTQLWQIGAGKPERVRVWANLHSMYLKFSEDGSSLLSCGWDGRLSVIDTASLQEHHYEHVFPRYRGALQCGAFAFDGNRLAVSSASGEVAIFDRDTEAVTARLKGHTSQIRSIRFTKDRKRLLVGLSEHVKVWDIELGQELIDIPFPGLRPLDLILLENESTLVFRGDNGMLFIKRLKQ